VLILIAIIFIFPLIFMLMSSLKPDQQLLRDTESLRAFLPVGDISLNNYTAAFDRAPVACSSSTRCSSPGSRWFCRFWSVRWRPLPLSSSAGRAGTSC
jgi:ABC-type glycerol-3-phosphate transport system permease component